MYILQQLLWKEQYFTLVPENRGQVKVFPLPKKRNRSGLVCTLYLILQGCDS